MLELAENRSPENQDFTVVYDLSICCESEVEKIAQKIKARFSTSVQRVTGQIENKQIKIVYFSKEAFKQEDEKIKKAIQEMGFSFENSAARARKSFRNGLLSGVFGIALFSIDMIGFQLSSIALFLIASLSFLVVCYAGRDMWRTAYKQICDKTLTLDTLFSFSTAVAWIAALVSLLAPSLAFHISFNAPLLLLGFRNLGNFLQEKAQQATLSGLHQHDCMPETVALVTEETGLDEYSGLKTSEIKKATKFVPIEQLKKGDIICIPSNTTLPVNGKCLTEKGQINKSIINGVDEPYDVTTEETLLSGMKAVSQMYLLVTETAEESYWAQQQKWIHEAEKNKVSTSGKMEKFLKYFLPIVIFIALGSGLVTGFFWGLYEGIKTALSIVMAICPCVIGFLKPGAIQVSLGKAEKSNMKVIDTETFEIADQVEGFTLDVNGTLTLSTKKITREYFYSPENRKEALQYLYALEKQEEPHSIASAICSYVLESKGISTDSLPEPRAVPDEKAPLGLKGIRATLGQEANSIITVGNRSFLEFHQINIPKDEKKRVKVSPPDNSSQIIYIAKDKEVLGYVELESPLRPDAKHFITELTHRRHKAVMLCSGAPGDTVMGYAKELGIGYEIELLYRQRPSDEFIKENRSNNLYVYLKNSHEKKDSPNSNYLIECAALKTDKFNTVVERIEISEEQIGRQNFLAIKNILASTQSPPPQLNDTQKSALYQITSNRGFNRSENPSHVKFGCVDAVNVGESKTKKNTVPAKISEILRWKKGYEIYVVNHWPMLSESILNYRRSFVCVRGKEGQPAMLMYVDDASKSNAVRVRDQEGFNAFVNGVLKEEGFENTPLNAKLTAQQSKQFSNLLLSSQGNFPKKTEQIIGFAGDGQNDLPPLAGACELGFLLQNSDNANLKGGQVRVLGTSLQPILNILDVSKQMNMTIALGLIFAAIYNISVVAAPTALLFIMDYSLDPIWEVAFMSGESLLICAVLYLFKIYSSGSNAYENLENAESIHHHCKHDHTAHRHSLFC